MYRINHHAYCGMGGVPACFEERADARQYAAEQLRRYRKHFAVTILERGKTWEVLEPENCAMVPDACGTLSLSHETFECFECGYGHESKHDAAHCCILNRYNQE
jgi:hypothetical protein